MHEQQLTLQVRLPNEATFTNFFSTQNNELINLLQTQLKESSGNIFYLWGSEGVGKTHLLQACCLQALANNKQVSYLSFKIPHLDPTVLEHLDEMSLVCLDDVEHVIGILAWEEALFHFYNAIKDKNHRLVVAANGPPRQLNWSLPDLQSRFSWAVVYQVHGLTDSEKCEVLQLRAQQKGLLLSEDSANFLLRRCSRDMSTLLQTLDDLDVASLQSKRPLSIPFIKSVLGI